MIEPTPPHDTGMPVHSLLCHAEGCYVVAWALAMTQDKQTTTLTAGVSALVRPGTSNSYRNPTATSAIRLLIYRPGVTEAEANALVVGASDGIDKT